MDDDPTLFPDVRLDPAGETSRLFRERDVSDLHEAIRYVRDLPYRRTSDPADYLAVPVEGVGTCSTKHGLLAALCAEQEVDDVSLTLGIFEMNGRNRPPVGPVLARHGLEFVPEAHCYLRYGGGRFDFTRSSSDGAPIQRFLHEETIGPDQIGAYKEERHRAFLSDWSASVEYDADELWEIREACIEALSAAAAGE